MKNNNQQIYLKVTNNTPSDVDLNILGDPWGPNNPQINADINFDWDLTPETFVGLTTLTIQYSANQAGPFTNYSKPFSGTNINELADSLSEIGWGRFYVSGTTLYTYSSGNVFFADLLLA